MATKKLLFKFLIIIMKNIPNFNKDRFKTHVFTTLRNNPTASNLDILDD
jgi:hypothetical protein